MAQTDRPGAISALQRFFTSEAGGGILLMTAAAAALILANSDHARLYHDVFHLSLAWSPVAKLDSLHKWINDGLMAVFFFVVGLEIKRELVDGRLSSAAMRRLPVVAAVAGMVVPALVFLGMTRDSTAMSAGWAIPTATDIAFAIGVLALLGRRAPTALKLFLVTVAIVDDMGAVIIIALVFTPSIALGWLAAAAVVLAAMIILNRRGALAIWPYLVLALLLWFCVLHSGVHATIAGVLAALAVPIVRTPGAPDAANSPLHRLEHIIHPWSAYVIVPLFGFANAGIALGGVSIADVLAPLPLGIALGLFLGKQVGIFGAVWLAVRIGFARQLRGATWLQIHGVAMLCGIGFTMSLFIGELAFAGNDTASALLREEAKIGILLGSVLSAVAGYLLLRFAPLHPRHDEIEAEAAAEIARDGDVEGVSEREAAL